MVISKTRNDKYYYFDTYIHLFNKGDYMMHIKCMFSLFIIMQVILLLFEWLYGRTS